MVGVLVRILLETIWGALEGALPRWLPDVSAL